jgi:hypothetical protein
MFYYLSKVPHYALGEPCINQIKKLEQGENTGMEFSALNNGPVYKRRTKKHALKHANFRMWRFWRPENPKKESNQSSEGPSQSATFNNQENGSVAGILID